MANKVETISVAINGVSAFINGEMYHIRKDQIAEVFEKYGGSFTQALGIALYRADRNNTQKILEAFTEMTKEFIEQFIDIEKL